MKLITCVTLVFFSFPVFAAPKSDEDCKKMAEFAKGIATLRMSGVTLDNFRSYITQPKVSTFPIQSVSEYVYKADLPTPDKVYSDLYDKCYVIGYKNLFDFFTEQEVFEATKIENEQLRTEVKRLQEENQSLKVEPKVEKVSKGKTK